MPSDLSEDEWGEVQRFKNLIYQKQQQQAKNTMHQKMQDVKSVLDNQVKLDKVKKSEEDKVAQEMDQQILQRCHKEIEQEKEMQRQRIQKMLDNKRMRDVMLNEAKQRKALQE